MRLLLILIACIHLTGRLQLPPETTEVFISAAGSGSAIIQLSTTYNLKETAWIESERRSFYSDVLVMNSSTQYRVDLEICPRETRDKKQYALMSNETSYGTFFEIFKSFIYFTI